MGGALSKFHNSALNARSEQFFNQKARPRPVIDHTAPQIPPEAARYDIANLNEKKFSGRLRS